MILYSRDYFSIRKTLYIFNQHFLTTRSYNELPEIIVFSVDVILFRFELNDVGTSGNRSRVGTAEVATRVRRSSLP